MGKPKKEVIKLLTEMGKNCQSKVGVRRESSPKQRDWASEAKALNDSVPFHRGGVEMVSTGAVCSNGMCPYVPCVIFPKCKHVKEEH